MQCQIASEKIATIQLIKTREFAADCQLTHHSVILSSRLVFVSSWVLEVSCGFLIMMCMQGHFLGQL
jgi:hypothetical protein